MPRQNGFRHFMTRHIIMARSEAGLYFKLILLQFVFCSPSQSHFALSRSLTHPSMLRRVPKNILIPTICS